MVERSKQTVIFVAILTHVIEKSSQFRHINFDSLVMLTTHLDAHTSRSGDFCVETTDYFTPCMGKIIIIVYSVYVCNRQYRLNNSRYMYMTLI